MNRRDFSQQLAALGLTAALPAFAQGGPVEGKHYQRLGTPVPVQLPPGKKVEVVEFFSWACPHCFDFEPALEAWVKTLPADVAFRQVPVPFVMGRTWVPKVFYGLEEIGQREAMSRKVFSAFHVQRLRLIDEDEAVAFLVSQGVDKAKLTDAMKSFSVNTKVQKVQQLVSGYKVNGVPTMGIQGRFTAASEIEGSRERAFQAYNLLIERARQGA